MNRVELRIAGSAYPRWVDVRISMALSQVAWKFDLTFHGPAADVEPLPFEEGDACAIAVYDSELFPAYLQEVNQDADATTASAQAVGLSTTGDLVDCAAIHKGGSWQNRTLTQIASDLCAPFGVKVRADVDVGRAFERFAIQDSETVHEALVRGARMRGLLIMTDIDGALVFTRASSTPISTVLERGVNLLSGGTRLSNERFSKYIVKAQSSGTDTWSGAKAAGGKAEVTDDTVKRYRPIIVHAEGGEAGSRLKDRALWERNTRWGKSREYRARVRGWSHRDGIWTPNTLVRVRDARFGVDEKLVVSAVNLSFGNDTGEIAEMTLTRREAFDVEPLVPKPKKGSAF